MSVLWLKLGCTVKYRASGNLLRSALRISLVLRLYFILYPSSRHNTDKIYINTLLLWKLLWKLKKNATWSTSGAQVLHIVLTYSDHYMKGIVFPPVVSGSPELRAGSSVIGRASPQMQGVKFFKSWAIMVHSLCCTFLKGDSMVGHHIDLNQMHPGRSSCLNLSANGLNGMTD